MVVRKQHTKEEYDYVHELRRMGLKFSEIAKWTGINSDTVNGWLVRGVKPHTMWTNWGWWFKGQIPWDKGKPRSRETREKISESKKGSHLTEETKHKLSLVHRGQIPWCKGLTKETDGRMKKIGEATRVRCLGSHWHVENGKRVWMLQ
jgi:hypothetical protein